MKVKLIKYAASDIPEYIDGVIKRFCEALANAGMSKEDSQQKASSKVLGEFFPGKKANDRQFVFHICDQSKNIIVGWLWLAQINSAELRVAEIYIDETYRRNGYGRKAMTIAEAYASQNGFNSISLNVFTANEAACALYATLAYHADKAQNGHQEMRKSLELSLHNKPKITPDVA